MASSTVIIQAFLVLFLAYVGNSQKNNDSFIFHGFKGDSLCMDGSSIITSNGLLQLTNQTGYLVGHGFYPSPIINMLTQNYSSNTSTVSSFSTSFVFGIIPSDIKKGGGHGFAFAISPASKLSGSSASHFLGLFNDASNGNPMNHVFAVEFDTVGAAGGFGDHDSNHVGIDVNTVNSSYQQPAPINMEEGRPIKVWIEYDGVRKFINVTLSDQLDEPRPSTPLISEELDLSKTLIDPIYVGFSASTGKLASSHYILGWSFRLNGTAQEIESSLLPSLPTIESPGSSKKHAAFSLIPATFLVVALVALFYMYRMRKKRQEEILEDWELDCPHRFRYKDLHIATKGFNASEVIGIGGFGTVYKGVLPKTGEQIAVKRILHGSRQGVREFVAEIESLGKLRHKNLVHLLGWCKRNEDLLLVYDFIPNGSLDLFLLIRKDNFVLNWEKRFKIVRGIASALLYLHQDWEQVVVHRDIKASNILLDVDMNGRLGDFGLARLYDHGENPRTTRVVGTLGYIAPELARTGKATVRTDVFAYGTLLLVVACGKRPVDPVVGHSTLLDWVTECYNADRVMDVVDPKLNSSYVIEEMELVLKLGLLCSHWNPESRPSMRQVMRFLDGDDPLPSDGIVSDAYLHGQNFQSIFGDVELKNVVITSHSQSSSIAPVSTNSLEGGR
ncbi:Receptor lectin protein kinase-like [Thalictrum thalictroides]|uniref:non-specific serine/threonine protein kinase n=1 Tax=Thalictrum thalictroides TaxID=46969 RepID=A0A7J6XAN2_THATH|nr:Receptor lectin protein kinase-like [Thalictrum thalictroides]